MSTTQPTYRSYLLRLWQTTNKMTVRASLVNVQDPAEQHYFVTIDDLYLFLHTTCMAPPDEQDKSSNGATQNTIPWGISSDTPAPADFDGDGKADPTIVRNENGQLTWWILDSSTGAKHNIPFGQSGDIPAP